MPDNTQHTDMQHIRQSYRNPPGGKTQKIRAANAARTTLRIILGSGSAHTETQTG